MEHFKKKYVLEVYIAFHVLIWFLFKVFDFRVSNFLIERMLPIIHFLSWVFCSVHCLSRERHWRLISLIFKRPCWRLPSEIQTRPWAFQFGACPCHLLYSVGSRSLLFFVLLCVLPSPASGWLQAWTLISQPMSLLLIRFHPLCQGCLSLSFWKPHGLLHGIIEHGCNFRFTG